MTFGAAIKSGFENLTNFKGRARRSEFWWFYLFLFIVSIPLTLLAMIPLFAAFTSLDWTASEATSDVTDQQVSSIFSAMAVSYGVAIVLSGIVFFLLVAVWVRRLHDAGYSGHWLWLSLAGLSIVPLIFACLEGNRFSNQWGPDPKALENAAWPQPAAPPQYAQPAPRLSTPSRLPFHLPPCLRRCPQPRRRASKRTLSPRRRANVAPATN